VADESKGILARLMTETWPAKAAGGILDALMLPGQVAGGILNVPPSRPGYWSDEDEAKSQLTNQTMMNRATDLGGLMMLGSGAIPGGANELRAGIRPYQNVPDELMGMRRQGPQRAFEEQAYQHQQPVEIVLRPMFGGKPEVFQDVYKGLNAEHAAERAYRAHAGEVWNVRNLPEVTLPEGVFKAGRMK